MGLAYGYGAGIHRRRVGARRYHIEDSDAQAYVDAMAVAPDDTHKQAIDTLFIALKAAGVWPKLDLLYLFAAHDAQAARINARNPGTFDATEVAGGGTLTHIPGSGYQTDGVASYLRTHFNATLAAGQYAEASAHLGVVSLTDAGLGGQAIGAQVSSTAARSTLNPRTATDTITYSLNHAAAGAQSHANAVGSGIFFARRTGANAQSAFRDGVKLGDSVLSSAGGLVNHEFYVGASNQNGAAASFHARLLSAASIGGGLTDQEIADADAALYQWLEAVHGTPLPF
jgi:hypothetical protein